MSPTQQSPAHTGVLALEREMCLGVVASRDSRFDGVFYTAVTSTGIYCRPSCPAMTPKAQHMQFYASAAAARDGGFRACKRCRPDATPGSPEWDVRADVVARAMRLIADGVVDREGVPELARRLGYSVRQLQRLLTEAVGAGPLALSLVRRTQTARVLIENSALPLTDVAFAAGFGSVRAFNEAIQGAFAVSPSALRQAAEGRRGTRPAEATAWVPISLRLAFRRPLEVSNLFGHLIATGVPGVEEWREGAYRRTLQLPHGPGIAELTPQPDHVAATLWLTDVRDLTPAVERCRRLLDLDADPIAVDEALARDPALAPLVARAPGRRVPRTVDGDELALRIVLGQQISTAAARTHAARLVVRHGMPLEDPHGGLTHLFPTAAALVDADPEALRMPASRARTLRALATALASGDVDLGPGADRAEARLGLAAIPGIGPWTIECVLMRGLGDPDAFPASDLGIAKAMKSLDLPAGHDQRWRPWRSYAVQHLWATDDHPINRLPLEDS